MIKLLLIQYRIGAWVVVHLHLAIHLQVLASGSDVSKELVDGCGEVHLLFEQHVKLCLAFGNMLRCGIGTCHLLLHVVNLQCQYGETVHSPCRRLGVDSSISQSLNILIQSKEIAVDTDTSESDGKTAIHSGKKPQRASLMQIKAMGAKEFYKGNWEGALPYYFEVLKICRNAESFEMIGIIFEKMDKLPDAFDAYEQAYLLGMDDRRNVTRLGLIGEQIGRYDKAQKYLESAIQSNPERADVVLSYARCLDNLGEGLAAAQVLDVLRDTSSSYAVKKAAESEYKRLLKKNGVSEDKMRAKAVEKK